MCKHLCADILYVVKCHKKGEIYRCYKKERSSSAREEAAIWSQDKQRDNTAGLRGVNGGWTDFVPNL